MTDIAFYHLQKSPLEAVLPRLLQRTLDAGKRAVVVAGSEDRVENLNAVLWTFDPGAWLPHGSAKDGRASDQPVWLTARAESPNAAQFLFLVDGCETERLDGYERCFDLFDGNDNAAVEAARRRWKVLKDAGHALIYWRQNGQGKWEQAAAA